MRGQLGEAPELVGLDKLTYKLVPLEVVAGTALVQENSHMQPLVAGTVAVVAGYHRRVLASAILALVLT